MKKKLSKLSDNIKQYGIISAFKQIFLRGISKVYFTNSQYVFLLNKASIEEDSNTNIDIIEGSDSHEYLPFIGRDLCSGEVVFVYKENSVVKGYAFIQSSGVYTFSKGAKIRLNSDMFMLKNLFVYSEFRGEKIGLKLNRARVAYAKKRANVLVLVLKENRAAIRNIEKVGFEKMALFKLTILFNYFKSNTLVNVGSNDSLVKRLKLLMEL